MMSSFKDLRRQIYIDEESYENTLAHYAQDETSYAEQFEKDPRSKPGDHASTLQFWASTRWETLQLRYTGGAPLVELREYLEQVVLAQESYMLENDDLTGADYAPPFRLADMIDNYVDYLGLLCFAILLHREDLIPRIFRLIDGTYDGADAVLEELFKFYIPDRPSLDSWLWEKPYRTLLDAIDSEGKERESFMRKYVSTWYKSMKGQAHFWGKHEQIEPAFSPYHGYWAVCAAAFTYLYDIDDSSYRDEVVYPKDLVDFARSAPRRAVVLDDGVQLLRVLGGQPCPKEGKWFSPAKIDSTRYFKAGEVMPSFDASEYGATIWQWVYDPSDSRG